MKVLAINSYAGSLVLGARDLGCNIIGSYEDAGFGLEIQRANIPDLHFIANRRDWPSQDLSDTIVIAHPPCSAFSVQNCSPTARGVNSEAFACTKVVLQYAVENNALGIAIESVMGALGGAWNAHQDYADAYGYHLYRILENGCMYGCQWRERFWVLYVKEGVASPNMRFAIQPTYQTVYETTWNWEDGPSAGNQDVLLEKQKERLIKDAKLTDEEMSYLFDPQSPPHPTKALGTILYEKKFKTEYSTSMDKWDVFQLYIGGFASGTMVFLDPDGLAPVLMGGSHWYMNGRNVSEDAFKRIMGFPGDYYFPDYPRSYRNQMRMYLSKGVMPPIAQWILEETAVHLGMTDGLNLTHTQPKYELECEPNHIVDFRIKKDDWWLRDSTLPPLRREEDIMLKLTRTQPTPTTHISITPPPPPPPPKPIRERPIPIPRDRVFTSRLGQRRLQAGPWSITPLGGITDKKRRIIHQIIEEIGEISHEDAITRCCEHPELAILPTTMHWHIRQMVKYGQLMEVG